MCSFQRTGLSRGLALSMILSAVPAAAQFETLPPSSGTDPVPLTNSPSDQLAANLVRLGRNPRDVYALIGAGESAVVVGDGQAALSFLSRADEISPNNGRVKAALGSAMVMTERPTEALQYFAQAASLGIPEAAFARDRGLAYDLRGDSRRAQRDYATALAKGPDDEVTRRLALSYGISGERDRALNLLDPLLRKQDQAAWRARAFVFAMAGDVRGAEGIAKTVLPTNAGQTMGPFLRRLAGLNAAERALAVNFGTMPSEGQRYARVATGDPYQPVTTATSQSTRSVDATIRVLDTNVRDPRRIPGQQQLAVATVAPPSPVQPAAQAAPSWVTKPAPKPIVSSPEPSFSGTADARLSSRLETRIGPVDRSKLDPTVQAILAGQARIAPVERVGAVTSAPAAATPLPPTGFKPQLTTMTSLPPPDSASSSRLATMPSPPPAAFEIPDKPVSAPQPTQVAMSLPVTLPPAAAPKPAQAPTFEVPAVAPAVAPKLAAAVIVPAAQIAAVETPPYSSIGAPSADPTPTLAPPASPTPALVTPVETPPVGTLAMPVTTLPPAAGPVGLASIIASIEPEAESVAGPLPTAPQIKALRLAAQRKAAATSAADAKAEAAAKAAAELAAAEKAEKEAERLKSKKQPARIWVQVATGANENGLPATWKHLRDKAPDTFKGLSASTVPFKATNRLLVGPFKSQSEARALVNAMNKSGMSGSTFSSDAGQEIGKISSR
jgi:Flp pilus assembly protein TadD